MFQSIVFGSYHAVEIVHRHGDVVSVQPPVAGPVVAERIVNNPVPDLSAGILFIVCKANCMPDILSVVFE